jgi:hypothetical protein
MGSGKLGGYCSPCYQRLDRAQVKKQVIETQYSKEGPYIFRDNFIEYGVRVDTKPNESLYQTEYPCMSNKYGIQKEIGRK